MIIFSSLYTILRDSKIIGNSIKLIQKSKNIQKFLEESKEESPAVIFDPIYQSLSKVIELREKMYKRNLKSAITSVAMTITLVASTLIAIAAAIAAAQALLIGASIVAGSLLAGHSIKCLIEWKGRLDKHNSREILVQTEYLRASLPPHLDYDP